MNQTDRIERDMRIEEIIAECENLCEYRTEYSDESRIRGICDQIKRLAEIIRESE